MGQVFLSMLSVLAS